MPAFDLFIFSLLKTRLQYLQVDVSCAYCFENPCLIAVFYLFPESRQDDAVFSSIYLTMHIHCDFICVESHLPLNVM